MTESSYKYLYRIDSPADLRKLSQQELVGYCDEPASVHHRAYSR